MRWAPFAMVRIAVVFIAGILFSISNKTWISPSVATVFLTIFTGAYFFVWWTMMRSRRRKLFVGIFGTVAVFSAGFLIAQLKDESKQPGHLTQSNTPIKAYQVKLISACEEKEKSLKRLGSVVAIQTEKGWQPAFGKVNLYWPKTENVYPCDYGDVLLIKGQPKEVERAFNPGEFDFKEFLKYKNTYHQQFVRAGEWVLCEKSHDRGLIFYAHRARNWSVATLKRYITSPREQGIVIALIIGVTDGLDNELLSAYSASGTMHVLAVSGLHVSIIYGILLLIFKPLGKGQAAHWITAIVSLILLWAYAFITGLSPSVLRAVAMVSFVAIAKPFGRNTNIYNTLAASAFCLLLYDPFLIMSVGFQLSYLAVLGIVYLQRPLYNLWEAKYAIVDWAWQLSCVSIAAQLTTFGLGLLYFHQFPIYFLLSNLFVIPASFVVLVGGILLLIISPASAPSSWLGIALEWFVKILNEGVFLVEKLPFCLIDGVWISGFQCFLLFLFVLGILIFIQFKKIYSFYFAFASVAIFSAISWQRFSEEVKINFWIVYRVQGQTAMEWTAHGHSYFMTDSAFANDKSKLRFHVEPNRLAHAVNTVHPISTGPGQSHGLQLYCFRGKTFLWLQSREFRLPKKVSVNYLIVSNNSLKSIQATRNQLDFDHLIIDGSNSYYYADRLLKEAQRIKKPASTVLRDGAFTLEL